MPDTGGDPTVDSYVQVAPDSTGKKIDNAKVTQYDATVVYRQRVALVDADSENGAVSVHGELDRGHAGVLDASTRELLTDIREILHHIREMLFDAL